MHSIKGTKNIEFNYNISSIRKISDTEYQYHGKPNSPNLVLSNGIKRISYVAERIEMKENELIIHHSATSNFSKEAMVIFPLVVSEGRETTIDRLLGMEMNETLDLDIGSEITDFTMEINEKQKSAYVVRLSGGLPISKKPTIIEGACGLTNEEKLQLQDAHEHSKIKDGTNPHKHKIDSSEFKKLMNDYIQNAGKCMVYSDHKSDHKIKLDGDIITNVDRDPSEYEELTKEECTEEGGTMVTPFADVPGGFREGSSFLTSNQEMECFPNEGGVFNLKFHIIYDTSGEQFIAKNGVKFKRMNTGVSNDDTLREAMKAEVKNLKEHIEKLGGIYVPEAKFSPDTNFAYVTDQEYKYIQSDVSTPASLTATSEEFFGENERVDIFITYVADSTGTLRRFTGTSKDAGGNVKLEGESSLTKPHQAKESILVAVRNGTDRELMNAKKFSEDYLNKDFNRYTHISIPGYMTETENQSMKAIMAILLLIFASLISYYTIPGFYKISIEKITGYSQDCKRGDRDPYGNYYLATAFNYLFAIITILIPLIMMITSGANAVLSGIMILGIIFMIAIYARHTIDRMFFHSFYPRERGQMCNKTKAFIKDENAGSRFMVFKYMPSVFSAFTSRNTLRNPQ